MLASITPLGERGRGSRWSVTLAFFFVGSMVAGVGLGGGVGTLGQLVGIAYVSPANRGWVLVAMIVLGLSFEFEILGLKLPSPRRQVNEQWLDVYRGWVYGLGFGFQLGLGVVTIVTTSAIYVTFMAAFLAGSALSGSLIGLTFAVIRASTILSVARVRRPEQLISMGRRLSRLEPTSRSVGLGAQLAVAGVLALALTVGI